MKHLRHRLPQWMLLLIPTAVLLMSYSDGPPPSRTGAPGELSCYHGYCHNSSQVNTGPGALSLAGKTSSQFLPGQPFELELAVQDSGMAVFGFSLSSRIAGRSDQAGSWPSGPELLVKSEGGREYLMHDTVKVELHEGRWTFQWQPPDTLSGPVEMYLAAVAGNANGNRQGDRVYTRKFTFYPDSLSAGIQVSRSNLGWFVEGNTLHLRLPRPSELADITIHDLRGHLLWQERSRGEEATIDISAWPQQMYLVRVKQGQELRVGKILLQR